MNAGIFDYTPFANLRKGRRGWWLTPPRPGMHRLIAPWEYRHLRAWASVRTAIGAVLVGLGAVTLAGGSFSPKAAGWATLFLAAAAAQLLFAAWERAIARSASART